MQTNAELVFANDVAGHRAFNSKRKPVIENCDVEREIKWVVPRPG